VPEPLTVEQVVNRVSRRKLTYLPEAALHDLAAAVDATERAGLPGQLLECGTALGGSAIVMAAAKDPARRLRLFDMFGTIPPPTAKDGEKVQQRYESIARGESKGIRGDVYYGYREDLLREVRRSFRRLGLPPRKNNVELVKGDFHDTLRIDHPVALAHLDGDWYESTLVCLERIVPHLVVGGRLVIDDYHFWEGCQQAVDEYFEGRAGFLREQHERLHIVRTATDG
jgi:hypothetical protein